MKTKVVVTMSHPRKPDNSSKPIHEEIARLCIDHFGQKTLRHAYLDLVRPNPDRLHAFLPHYSCPFLLGESATVSESATVTRLYDNNLTRGVAFRIINQMWKEKYRVLQN